jgi:hypothetical protein
MISLEFFGILMGKEVHAPEASPSAVILRVPLLFERFITKCFLLEEN